MKAANYVRERFGEECFDVALLGGSGIDLFEGLSVPYSEVPGMPVPQIEGHKGKLTFFEFEGIKVLSFEGRFHYYEGRSDEEIRFIPNLASALGCKLFIVTSAVGAVSRKAADLEFLVIEDHVNFMGRNPLVGLVKKYGSKAFLNAKKLYDRRVSNFLFTSAADTGAACSFGVIASMLGPSYETIAEVKILDKLGIDVVTMSFVPEALCAKFYGMKVAGIAVVTNDTLKPEQTSHEEVLEITSRLSRKLREILKNTLLKCKFNNVI